MLSERAQTVLQQIGWFPGRTTDLKSFEQAYAKYGYRAPYRPELPFVIRQFITEFGGLNFEIVLDKANSVQIRLDPIEGSLETPYEGDPPPTGLSDDYWPIGVLYWKLGSGIYNIDTLLMDSSGWVYRIDHWMVYLIAKSPLDAIERLANSPASFEAKLHEQA
jgi:hypothetical protein